MEKFLESLKDDLDQYTHQLNKIEKRIDEEISTTLKELYKCYIILKNNTEKRIDEIKSENLLHFKRT